ncbi:c-type cytochrome [Tropicimonas sp. S265A]|uniref:c-type cytochrome n=1 Tax=Tropicimonas sp. S265A TaxID=3415134 RepID=UPI003C7A5400
MTRLNFAICATFAAAISAAQAGDVTVGQELYGDTCANCHGPTAKGMASYPGLAGKEQGYLINRLETYRAGEKVGPNSALMIPMAADLSDDDIANIAAFLAGS